MPKAKDRSGEYAFKPMVKCIMKISLQPKFNKNAINQHKNILLE